MRKSVDGPVGPVSQGRTLSSMASSEASLLDEHIQEILNSKTPFANKRQATQKYQELDSLRFFYIVKELEKELGFIKLENIVLFQFLEKNDPKYLVGLKKTLEERANNEKSHKIQFTEQKSSPNLGNMLGKQSTMQVTGSMMSMGSTMSATINKSADVRLNYNIKSEICEKYFMDLKRRFEKSKAKAVSQVKCLRARIDELVFFNDEIRGTVKSFQDSVINLGLDPKTGRIPSEKFSKYFMVWNKNAMGLISNLRLKIQSLHEQCYQLKTLIVKKADLAGMLGPADFEQMQIKKDAFTRELEDRNIQLIKIKRITGKASSALATQRNILLQLEIQLKRLISKINDCVVNTNKMEREMTAVEIEIGKVENNIEMLDEKMIKFDAPDVSQYIEQNNKLIQLERREKLLKRQVEILALKLKNVKIKIMQRKQKN